MLIYHFHIDSVVKLSEIKMNRAIVLMFIIGCMCHFSAQMPATYEIDTPTYALKINYLNFHYDKLYIPKGLHFLLENIISDSIIT